MLIPLLLATAAAADPRLADLRLADGGTFSAAEAIDGETLRLSDGRELRLATIETAHALAPRNGDRERPDAALRALAEAARAAANDLAVRQGGTIYFDRQREDRYGRLVAHVETADGLWLQAELVSRGLARVHTTPETAAAAAALLKMEDEARRARRGLWTHSQFRVREPDDTARWLDSFQIVEGQIASARQTRTQTWLVFAGEHGKALSITAAPGSRARLRAGGLDLAALDGALLRVRGWIQWRNGPLIEIDHPEQVEVITPPGDRPARRRR